MPISGLVITLSADPGQAARALSLLAAHPAVLPGERTGRWLPVAVESGNDAESRALHEWVQTLPGVEFVDVVYVNYEPDDGVASSATKANHEHRS